MGEAKVTHINTHTQAEAEGSCRHETRTKEVNCMPLTKGGNDGASDAVGHTDCKDAHGPSVLQAKLELVGLTLRNVERTREQHLSPADLNPQRDVKSGRWPSRTRLT